MEIWCNEAQERYVLGVRAEDLAAFRGPVRARALSLRGAGRGYRASAILLLDDRRLGEAPVDVPLHVILGKAPRLQRDARSRAGTG